MHEQITVWKATAFTMKSDDRKEDAQLLSLHTKENEMNSSVHCPSFCIIHVHTWFRLELNPTQTLPGLGSIV